MPTKPPTPFCGCQPTRDLLIDFSDGELGAIEAELVSSHLEHCTSCRRELARLRRSLDCALVVWSEPGAWGQFDASRPAGLERANSASSVRANQAASSARAIVRRPGWVTRPRVVACVAMGLVLLVAGALAWHVRRPAATQVVARKPVPSRPAEILDDAQIEQILALEVRSARLAASAQLLDRQPGAEEFALRAHRYLARAFPQAGKVRRPESLP